MPDTVRTQAELLALFADNTTGDISEQAGRDLIVSMVPIISDTDPGAIGAGRGWVRTDSNISAGWGEFRQLYIRNAANDGWIEAGCVHYDANGLLRNIISLSDGGIALINYDTNDTGAGAVAGVHGVVRGEVFLGQGICISQARQTDGTVMGEVVVAEGVTINATGQFGITIQTGGADLILTTSGGDLIANGVPFGGQAAFVNPATATAQQVAQSLINAGLMAAS